MNNRKRKPFGERLVSTMQEATRRLDAGEALPTTTILLPPEPPGLSGRQLSRMRQKMGLTQARLAEFLNVSEKTVESWEQETRRPGGAALRLIQLIGNPELLTAMTASTGWTPPHKPASRRLKQNA